MADTVTKMTRVGRLRWIAGRSPIVALAVGCAVAPSAGAMSRPGDGDLSPRLAELTKPSVLAAPPGKRAAILDVALSGAGSLLRQGNRLLADVRFDHGAAGGVEALRDAGARIVNVSRRYQTVTVAVPPASLPELGRVARVEGVTEILSPLIHGAEGPGPVSSEVTSCFGVATSEGDAQVGADTARATFDVDGSGVKVGVLSDSFDNAPVASTIASEDVASGDLPGRGNPCGYADPVDLVDDGFADSDASDEGRAMAQIVHDLAPGAEVAFATAFTGISSFAENIRALRDAGAKVILDDISYFEEPFFQEGPVGVAVSEVTASGVTYYSSAGNNNLTEGGKDISSWEAPAFRNAGSCPLGPPQIAIQCMDFDPGIEVDTTFGVTVEAGATLIVDLQWAQPWFGVTTDLDAYLLNSSDDVVAEGIVDNVSDGKGEPREFLAWKNADASSQTARLAIDRCALACNPFGDSESPRLKFALLQNGSGVTSTEYADSGTGDIVGPTIFGHNGSENAMSVAAVPFFNSNAIEPYSSRGPVTHYFEPVNGTTPAAPLESPLPLAKPDIAATDGGASTFFGSCLTSWRFFGTSAAAPHAAAVAALQLDAKNTATPAEIKLAQQSTADAVGLFAPGAAGAGLVDAVGAIDALGVASTFPGAIPVPAPASVSCEPGPVSGSGPTPVVRPNPIVLEPIVDRTAPGTFFGQRPKKLVPTQGRWARVRFAFLADEDRVEFLCKFDRTRSSRCNRNLVHSFGLGPHVIGVAARDAAGNVDSTPAVYRFRVKRIL